MALFEDLGLNDPTANDADASENRVTSGPYPQEGIHHAVLNGCREIAASARSGRELTFMIVAGPSKGKEVKEAVWLPNGSDSDQSIGDRAKLFMHRLGLLKKVEKVVNGKKKNVYEQIPGKDDFQAVTGAQVLIDVVLKEREFEGKNGKAKIKEGKLTWEGVMPLTDRRGEKVPKAKPGEIAELLGAAPPAAQSPAKPAARQFDDI